MTRDERDGLIAALQERRKAALEDARRLRGDEQQQRNGAVRAYDDCISLVSGGGAWDGHDELVAYVAAVRVRGEQASMAVHEMRETLDRIAAVLGLPVDDPGAVR